MPWSPGADRTWYKWVDWFFPCLAWNNAPSSCPSPVPLLYLWAPHHRHPHYPLRVTLFSHFWNFLIMLSSPVPAALWYLFCWPWSWMWGRAVLLHITRRKKLKRRPGGLINLTREGCCCHGPETGRLRLGPLLRAIVDLQGSLHQPHAWPVSDGYLSRLTYEVDWLCCKQRSSYWPLLRGPWVIYVFPHCQSGWKCASPLKIGFRLASSMPAFL